MGWETFWAIFFKTRLVTLMTDCPLGGGVSFSRPLFVFELDHSIIEM
jgi:hypothetical protein